MPRSKNTHQKAVKIPSSKAVTEPVVDAESKYLSQLTFDPSMRGHWSEVLFKNFRLLFLLMGAILFAGAYAWLKLPRELNPDVVIPAVTVVTALPGAAPKDVEQLVSQKIEKAARKLPNIDTVNSSSNQSVSVVTFQFLNVQDPDEAAQLVKDEVDLLVPELPDDATEPKVQKININDQPFLITALTGDTDRLSLSAVARNIKDSLEKVSGISKVEILGGEEGELVVELRPDSLKTYGLSDQVVIQALRANNLTLPAGTVSVRNLEYSVALASKVESLDDIRNIVVSAGGKAIRLGEVANVYERTKESNRFLQYQHGVETDVKPAVQLAIYKSENETIMGAERKTREVLKAELQKFPQISSIDVINFTTEISKTFSELQINFASSILLMFLVLMIFLGFRQASIAALSIPLVVFSAFMLTYLMGLSLNFLTLFSLLLALSLIGDDAIVMAEATTQYGKKFSSLETGLMVIRDFFIPIWVGTITVVWSFVPLLLSTGIIGEFIRPIPLVVTATLLSSTAIATLINLPLNIILRDAVIPRRIKVLLGIVAAMVVAVGLWLAVAGSWVSGLVVIWYLVALVGLITVGRRWWSQALSHAWVAKLKHVADRILGSQELISLTAPVAWYRKIVTSIVHNRWQRVAVVMSVIGLLILSGVFMATGLLKTEFFPNTDQDRLYINVEGPAGWPVEKTTEVLNHVIAETRQEPEILGMITATGGLFQDGFGGGTSGPNFGYVTLLLSQPEERNRTSIEIAEVLRQKFEADTAATITVTELRGGPPAGADIQVNLKGDSLEELERIANQMIVTLKEIPGTRNQKSSLRLTPGQITVKMRPQELAERGLTAQQVGGWLRTSLSGTKASDTVINNEDRDIVVYLKSSSQSLESLGNLVISGPMGPYTLNEVADLSLENSPTVIEREDGRRVVHVTAGVSGVTPPEVLKAFQEKVSTVKLPEGYSWDVGGVNEENEKSVQSIIQAMGVSFFLILVTIVLQLNSFRKAFLIMLVIPLAFIGVIINFTIFGIPLSFPALIGVLSLFGIVVNNALMLMDKINLNLEHGFTVEEAAIDGAASRLPAILLSSLSSVVGLLPVTLSDPLWQGLGGAIISGLSISGLLILLFLPSLYIEVFGTKKPA